MAETILDLSYMICTTPRTGSTALLKGLQKTGVAGNPVEYPDSVPYKGIYGVMVHMSQWAPKLSLLPAKRYAYIHLYREDIVAQSVSWNVASQTGRWHSYQNSKKDPIYDSEGIRLGVERIRQDNENWSIWLEDKDPILKLSYETLAADYSLGTMKVLEFLGLPRITVTTPLSKIGTSLNIEWEERWKESL